MRVLTGDIGGTNTRLMLVETDGYGFSVLTSKYYSSKQYSGVQQVVQLFLTENSFTDQIDSACFAVAGPVISGTSKITNLPWSVEEEQLVQDLGIPAVKLVNDFTAVALGIEKLDDTDFLVIQDGAGGNARPEHPAGAIIGAGTGLGVSHRVWVDNKYQILPSETGHAGFAPETELQTRLLDWLQRKYNHVSLEMVLSGNGLYTIYQFLSENKFYTESPDVKSAMLDNDPARIITEHALQNDDELCQKALDVFIEIYGTTAGNVALQYYPIDELFIAGGIAPKIIDKLNSRLFLEAFVNKGLLSSNLKNITIKVILNDKIGLYGALTTCLHFLSRNINSSAEPR